MILGQGDEPGVGARGEELGKREAVSERSYGRLALLEVALVQGYVLRHVCFYTA